MYKKTHQDTSNKFSKILSSLYLLSKLKVVKIILKKPSTASKECHSFLKKFSKRNKIPNPTAMDLDLVLGELLSNILNYGYKKNNKEIFISLECELIESQLQKKQLTEPKINQERYIQGTLIDTGLQFNPTSFQSKTPEPTSIEKQPIGGLGLVIVKKILSSMAYQRKDDKNHLKFSIIF